MSIAYLNGQFLPLQEARVPVLDRGYLFGDGVYEVLPAYNRTVFRLDAHLERLERSLDAIGMTPTISRSRWGEILDELLEHNPDNGQNQAVYLQVTRGVAPNRTHGIPRDCIPSVLAFTWPLPALSEKIKTNGVTAISQPDNRWHRCDIKAIALLANVMLADSATQSGHNEAILHREGIVTEGASSNVFMLKNDRLYTPVANELILHGVTRAFIMELAEESGIATEERNITLEELFMADEIWISSSTREVYPVTRLDDQTIGTGMPGKHWLQVYQMFQNRKIETA